MGLYIEPPMSDKKTWLASKGMKLFEGPMRFEFNYSTIPEDKVLVCNVENGFFDASAVAFNEAEYKSFNYPDGRNKSWWLLDKELAKEYSPQWGSYMGMYNG
jgi:hypothetical protein